VITYHRLPSGEWVAHGPAAEVQPGPVEIHKRSGSVCHRVVDAVEQAGDGTVYGYLTEHCKPESAAARDARLAAASPAVGAGRGL